MNNNQDIELLLYDIERWFDCKMTEDEEKQFKIALASTSLNHPAIEEAKAVLGFNTIKSVKKSRKPDSAFALHSMWKVKLTAAALIIAVLSIVIKLTLTTETPDECFAFVNGQCLTNEEDVMRLMMENIADLNEGVNEAQQEIAEELEVLFQDSRL